MPTGLCFSLSLRERVGVRGRASAARSKYGSHINNTIRLRSAAKTPSPRPSLGGRGSGIALMVLLLAFPAAAKDLLAGPGQPYDRPSAAIRAAQPGDQVLIEPGEYYDCASWTTPGLTIAGRGPGAVMTDTTCQDKAILVIGGEHTTLRNLTLARARVGDGNGAGVRLEAPGLILDRVTFRDNQVGLLSGSAGGAILATECRFEGGGVGGDRPLAAILVGASDQLLVRGSVFADLKGSAVSSGAADTTLVSNGFSGIGALPAVSAEGRLTLVGNRFEIGAGATGQPGAVLANGPTGPVLRGNRLLAARPLALLLDWSGGSPVLDGNQVGPRDGEVSTSGSWRHKASGAAHEIKDGLRGLAGRAKRLVLGQ
jgi:hypothetical protein